MRIPLPEIQSGKVDIAVNGKHVVTMDATDNNVTARLANEEQIKNIVRLIPRRAKHLRFLHRISALMDRMGIYLEICDAGGTIMELGKGAHSILGNVKIKMSRIRRII